MLERFNICQAGFLRCDSSQFGWIGYESDKSLKGSITGGAQKKITGRSWRPVIQINLKIPIRYRMSVTSPSYNTSVPSMNSTTAYHTKTAGLRS